MTDFDDIDGIAAEYVLGTLDPSERAAAEQRRPRDPALADAIVAWEQRLGPLAQLVPAVEPPRQVWSRIEASVDALRSAAATVPRVRRMPLGLLTDSVALADRGWTAVTVSRGSFRSLQRVHSRRDSLDHLTGSGIGGVATLLARAVEALT